jgi:hypothetical protein
MKVKKIVEREMLRKKKWERENKEREREKVLIHERKKI